MAVREGFEPSIESPLYTLSRGAPSATRPPHQLNTFADQAQRCSLIKANET